MIQIFPYKTTLTSNGDTSYLYIENYDKTIVVDYSSFDIQYKDIDIFPRDRVFISEFSSFSSLFLSRIDSIDISRTIHVDKSDKIIIDVVPLSVYKTGWYCEYKNTQDAKVITVFLNFRPTTCDNISKQVTRESLPDWFISSCKKATVINFPFELTSLLICYIDKIVFTEKLYNYVNNFLPKLNNDIISNLNDMLSGKDKDSVSLALNLLMGYNFSDYIIPVSSMIRSNYQNILKFKCENLSSLKHIINACGLTRNDVKHSTYLDFNYILYHHINTENDKYLLQDMTTKYIIKEVKYHYEKYLMQMNLDVQVS
jgi:hypothetical protein